MAVFEPEAAAEAERALGKFRLAQNADDVDRWAAAVDRVVDQIVETGAFLANWTTDDIQVLAEKILDRAAPRGVFAIAQQIIADPHRYDHMIKSHPDGWMIQHPVQERLDGTLFTCLFGTATWIARIQREIAKEPVGTYRLYQSGDQEVGLEPVEALQ